jgi:myo-inositol-1(or 4)-monophosphatase
MIVEIIKAHFPEHGIIAEEGGASQTKHEYTWFIDPLDGTTNFIQNLPHFSVSIALQKGSKIIAGVVFNPVLNEMFSAAAGEGAFLNDQPIRVNNDANFDRAVLATGFPHRFKTYLPKYVLAFQEIMLNCSGVRRWGSAALDLAYTACGRYHCFWELGLSSWDVAAGALIVQEAGGVVTDFWGGQNYLESGYMIAGSERIHLKLKEILSFHFKSEVN